MAETSNYRDLLEKDEVIEKKAFVEPSLLIEELSEKLYLSKLELQAAYDSLKKSEEARTELFANLSHDLRSPITAIQNALEYLLGSDEYPYEETTQMLQMMNRRVKILTNLINELFMLTTVENKNIPFELKTIGIAGYLETLFAETESDPKFSERKLYLELPDSIQECKVSIDPDQMNRVLDNLLSNALKYSKSGAAIHLGACEDAEGIRIYVSDTGIGMSSDECKRVFERTYVAQKARTPNAESGAGLGLSIVKEIVERHGGKACCESERGKGSTFSIILPCVK